MNLNKQDYSYVETTILLKGPIMCITVFIFTTSIKRPTCMASRLIFIVKREGFHVLGLIWHFIYILYNYFLANGLSFIKTEYNFIAKPNYGLLFVVGNVFAQ